MNPKTSRALLDIIGQDPGLRVTLSRAALVAPTRTPVLVTGESGTGKELLARALHELGPAPSGPFVAVNCGALPRELAESELFGHERGAFTGAGTRRMGWFEEASGGTLVLDEIGELPLDLQPKLLRVLDSERLRRVGGTGETRVNVRVIAMTHRDLARQAATAGGSFRLDLFHRLAGFGLTLPPLRCRPGDIAPLAEHFIREFAPEVGPRHLEAAAVQRLTEYNWPGNVRELRNVIRKAAILTGSRIDAASLELGPTPWSAPMAQEGCVEEWPLAVPMPADQAAISCAGESGLLSLAGKRYPQIEREVFNWALKCHGGSRRKAAHALGISRSTFCDRVKRFETRTPYPTAP